MAETDYSPLDRMLHRLALDSPARAELMHDIERSLYLRSAPQFEGGGHVFVTGLARAGTTVLMRELHASGEFGSLTYADMPFVLAPNLWARLSRHRRPDEPKERAHGDGITVTTQSPEALDEVYWRLLSGADYVEPSGLRPHVPGPEAIDGYRDCIRLVLRKTGKSRYLSKNNNLLLRLPALAEAWPDATFLIPVRRPVAHAASLLNQHRRFADSDAFTRSYMTWLGHHEFGATHRPFLFDSGPSGDPDTLDYWLQVWISAYRHILRIAAARDNVIPIPYEDLCRDPAVWSALQRLLRLPERPLTEVRVIPDRDSPSHQPSLGAAAEALYDELQSMSSERLRGSNAPGEDSGIDHR